MRMRRPAVALLCALSAPSAASSASSAPGLEKVRIGFYVGGGTSSDLLPFISTLRAGAAQAFPQQGFSLTNISAADVRALTPQSYDVVVFPGGSGGGQAEAVGEAGLGALRRFVAGGSGYIGTCGGAFLGLQHVLFYGSGPAGHGPPTQEPWDRGHGVVQVEFSPAGLMELNLPPQKFGGNVSIMCKCSSCSLCVFLLEASKRSAVRLARADRQARGAAGRRRAARLLQN